jgi:RecB family exonuclease
MANVVSFSRLQTFQRCPWLYHLVFDEKWRSGPTGSAALGQSLHQALDLFLSESNTDRSLERIYEIFDEVWVNEGFKSPQETFEIYESGRTMLKNFWEIDRQQKSKILFTEKEFGFDWEGIHIQGTLDRVDQTADGYEIVEYKTRGDRWTPERIEKDLQMTFYWWGASEGLGLKPLKLSYYFLSTGQKVEATRSDKDVEMLKGLVRDAAQKIQSGQFEPNFSYCAKCEIGKRCVNYKKVT